MPTLDSLLLVIYNIIVDVKYIECNCIIQYMLLTQTYRESTVARPSSSTKPLSRQGTRSLPRRKLSHNIPTPFKRHLGCKRKSCFIFRSVESFVSNTLVLFLNRGFATCHIISSSHRAKCKPFISRVLIKYFSKLDLFFLKFPLPYTMQLIE